MLDKYVEIYTSFLKVEMVNYYDLYIKHFFRACSYLDIDPIFRQRFTIIISSRLNLILNFEIQHRLFDFAIIS